MSLKSWTCKGCTNICYRFFEGEVMAYCKPVIEKGSHRTEWVTEDFIDCLDKTTDPEATDPIPRLHECYTKGETTC